MESKFRREKSLWKDSRAPCHLNLKAKAALYVGCIRKYLVNYLPNLNIPCELIPPVTQPVCGNQLKNNFGARARQTSLWFIRKYVRKSEFPRDINCPPTRGSFAKWFVQKNQADSVATSVRWLVVRDIDFNIRGKIWRRRIIPRFSYRCL